MHATPATPPRAYPKPDHAALRPPTGTPPQPPANPGAVVAEAVQQLLSRLPHPGPGVGGGYDLPDAGG